MPDPATPATDEQIEKVKRSIRFSKFQGSDVAVFVSQEDIAAILARLDAAERVRDALPLTPDGVTPVPGMTLYQVTYRGVSPIVCTSVEANGISYTDAAHPDIPFGGELVTKHSAIYGTEAAALAAAGKGSPQETTGE
jgi:hypothetical protein